MKKDNFVREARPFLNKMLFNKDESNAVADYCATAYDLPRGYAMDLIANRRSLADETDKILFYIADAIDTVKKTKFVDNFFTKNEKENYVESKYTGDIIDKIYIPCIEVHHDMQWIGSVDVHWLMNLRKANKIRYNADKQRVRQRLFKGEEPIFKNTVKEKSVREIARLMKDGNYIPDDITLDIPDDVECKYNYYDTQKEMVIDNIDTFDITDGYHRYLAMCRCYDEDPSFNYPTEIRITKFSMVRTQQFIYQKDQKNKMTITNSRSMNNFRPSNDVVNRLNERGSGFARAGEILRNEKGIEFAGLSDVIEYYWFKGKKEEVSIREIAQVKQEVQEIMNLWIYSDVDYWIERYIEFRQLVIFFWLVKDKKKTPQEAGEMLKRAIEKKQLSKIKNRTMRTALFNQLETIQF